VNPEKFIRQGICHKIEKLDPIFYGNSKIAILDQPKTVNPHAFKSGSTSSPAPTAWA